MPLKVTVLKLFFCVHDHHRVIAAVIFKIVDVNKRKTKPATLDRGAPLSDFLIAISAEEKIC